MGAFGWGLLASSSLLIGAAVTLLRPPGQRTVALVMAFGAGVLLSAGETFGAQGRGFATELPGEPPRQQPPSG